MSKKFLIMLMCLTLLVLAGSALSQQKPAAERATKSKLKVLSPEEAKAIGKVDLLFVQNAQSVTIDRDKLIMKGVSPTTLWFSDRPERLVGHLTTKAFMPFWSEGSDSFAANPPNATLSVLDGGKSEDIVVELRNPKLSNDELSYDVQVLAGNVPTKGGACSLFIDIIGRPLTPFSFAGADRRAWRRY